MFTVPTILIEKEIIFFKRTVYVPSGIKPYYRKEKTLNNIIV